MGKSMAWGKGGRDMQSMGLGERRGSMEQVQALGKGSKRLHISYAIIISPSPPQVMQSIFLPLAHHPKTSNNKKEEKKDHHIPCPGNGTLKCKTCKK